MVEVAKIVLTAGADWVSVNLADEVIILRESGIRNPVLVIGFTQKSDLAKLIESDARATVYDLETARKLSAISKQKGKKARIHIKVDTGMSRQGVLHTEALDLVRAISKLPNIAIEGLMTQYACADDPKYPACFNRQLENFNKVQAELKKEGIEVPLLHIANYEVTTRLRENIRRIYVK